jgi:hypothetical protein
MQSGYIIGVAKFMGKRKERKNLNYGRANGGRAERQQSITFKHCLKSSFLKAYFVNDF